MRTCELYERRLTSLARLHCFQNFPLGDARHNEVILSHLVPGMADSTRCISGQTFNNPRDSPPRPEQPRLRFRSREDRTYEIRARGVGRRLIIGAVHQGRTSTLYGAPTRHFAWRNIPSPVVDSSHKFHLGGRFPRGGGATATSWSNVSAFSFLQTTC